MKNENQISAAGSLIWTAAIALGFGVLVTVAIAAFILFVSNDMRWVLAIGSASLAMGSVWVGRRRRGQRTAFLLLLAPPLAFFGILAVPQLPGLWPHLAFWLGFALLGWFGFRRGRPSAKMLVAILAVTAIACWYAFAYVPGTISRSLSHYRNDPAPELTLAHLDGRPFDVASLQGKVVVLDFFGTWCAPCIAELPELDEIRRHFAGRDDVKFLVVANDSGGDTPESIQTFVDGRHLGLEFAYDRGGAAHSAFGFAGLPGLVVIDRSGRIRLTREGYNSAETGFREELETLVASL